MIAPVLGSLAPIVLIVVSGAMLLRFQFYDDRFRRNLDRLVYWVSVPALVVAKLAGHATFDGDAARVAGALLTATIGALAFAYALAWVMKLPRSAVGVFVQAGFRGNLAFVGLPVIVLGASNGRFDPSHIETQAVLVLAPMILFYNVVAVLVLELARSRIEWRVLPSLGKSVSTNPILLSCLVGIAVGISPFELSGPVEETLILLGATASPLALLSLGGTLVVYRVRENLGRSVIAALVKVAIVPLLAWLAGRTFGLDGEGMLVLMVYAAAPTAVASYVMASQLGGDEALAASSLVVTTVFCVVSLGVALSWSV